MRLKAKFISMSRAKLHCNRLTVLQDIQDYVSLIIGTHCTIAEHHEIKKKYLLNTIKIPQHTL